jgi:hypothetical protein
LTLFEIGHQNTSARFFLGCFLIKTKLKEEKMARGRRVDPLIPTRQANQIYI